MISILKVGLEFGKTNTVLSTVKDGVEVPDEGVTKDPDRQSVGSGNTQLALATVGILQHVDGRREGDLESSGVEGEGDGGEGSNVGAVGGDVSDGAVEGVEGVGWHDDEGGAGVDDDLAVGEEAVASTDGGSANGHVVEVDGPVVLGGDGDPVDGASVVLGVNLAKDDGALFVTRGGVEEDGEEGLRDQVLGDHLIEDGNNTIGGDGWVGETQDTVEGLTSEEVGEVSGFTEGQVLNAEFGNLDNVGVKDTVHASSSVLDGDALSVGDVG